MAEENTAINELIHLVTAPKLERESAEDLFWAADQVKLRQPPAVVAPSFAPSFAPARSPAPDPAHTPSPVPGPEGADSCVHAFAAGSAPLQLPVGPHAVAAHAVTSPPSSVGAVPPMTMLPTRLLEADHEAATSGSSHLGSMTGTANGPVTDVHAMTSATMPDTPGARHAARVAAAKASFAAGGPATRAAAARAAREAAEHVIARQGATTSTGQDVPSAAARAIALEAAQARAAAHRTPTPSPASAPAPRSGYGAPHGGAPVRPLLDDPDEDEATMLVDHWNRPAGALPAMTSAAHAVGMMPVAHASAAAHVGTLPAMPAAHARAMPAMPPGAHVGAMLAMPPGAHVGAVPAMTSTAHAGGLPAMMPAAHARAMPAMPPGAHVGAMLAMPPGAHVGAMPAMMPPTHAGASRPGVRDVHSRGAYGSTRSHGGGAYASPLPEPTLRVTPLALSLPGRHRSLLRSLGAELGQALRRHAVPFAAIMVLAVLASIYLAIGGRGEARGADHAPGARVAEQPQGPIAAAAQPTSVTMTSGGAVTNTAHAEAAVTVTPIEDGPVSVSATMATKLAEARAAEAMALAEGAVAVGEGTASAVGEGTASEVSGGERGEADPEALAVVGAADGDAAEATDEHEGDEIEMEPERVERPARSMSPHRERAAKRSAKRSAREHARQERAAAAAKAKRARREKPARRGGGDGSRAIEEGTLPANVANKTDTATGKVAVSSNVPALIYLDGRATGMTTPKQFAVPAGRHKITLLEPGSRKARTQDVEVVAGKSVAIEKQF